MDPMYERLEQRVTVVERKVDRMLAWSAGAAAVGGLLLALILWGGNEQLTELKESRKVMSSMATDVTIMKADQVRAARESDRAWRLLNAVLKKGQMDVTKLLSDDSP